MEINKIKRLYGRLKGLREIVYTENYVSTSTVNDYTNVVKSLSEELKEDLSSFFLLQQDFRVLSGNEISSNKLKEKLVQLLTYLEYGYNLNESIIETGSLYNSIKDQELKERCADILSASGNFDRVINQATLVLEDRIRTKSKSDRALIGTNLINKAINPDSSKSVLVVSENKDEQSGIADICRGIMGAYRNETHHTITDKYTREDALKVFAFIDNLLQIIDSSKVNKR